MSLLKVIRAVEPMYLRRWVLALRRAVRAARKRAQRAEAMTGNIAKLTEQNASARAHAKLEADNAERYRELLREIHWPNCAVFCDVQEERHGKPCDCPWSEGERGGDKVPHWEELHDRLVTTERALDQLMEQTEMRSPMTGHGAKLADVMRKRYGREAEQWRANHDERKAERDAAIYERDVMIEAVRSLVSPVWWATLSYNLRDAAGAHACAWLRGVPPAVRGY